ISRQIVRNILDDAERYAAYRVEEERGGTDYLTGALNRYGLDQRLNDLYSVTNLPRRRDVSGEQLPPVTLAHFYCDRNNLKWVNDNLGHHVGDKLIIGTASRLRELFRQTESPIIYRQGGDEFGIVLSNVDAKETAAITRRIVELQIRKVTGEQYRKSMQAITE